MDLVIVGASTRAAAFSALRAGGLRPWCVDLFADEDLRAVVPVTAVRVDDYPDGLGRLLRQAPPGPWMYTGGLENRPDLVAEWASERELWGNDAETLRAVRDPVALRERLGHGPRVRREPPPDDDGHWLVKPLAGTGGRGVRPWRVGEEARPGCYYQEFIEGEPRSAIFGAFDGETLLLGVTRQLVGEPWLNAPPFAYCGSIGPLPTGDPTSWDLTGQRLAERFRLCGLFGVDAVWRDGQAFVVEVNPRYTASVEVLEYATGLSGISGHAVAFDNLYRSGCPPTLLPESVVGKAVLFARRPFRFAAHGPWLTTLRRGFEPFALPAFADIPAAGAEFQPGQPVLSFFARAATASDCLDRLQATAEELNALL